MMNPPRSNHHSVTEEQIRILMNLNPEVPLHALFQLDMLTALRPPEITGLPWKNVFFHTRSLKVSQQLSVRNHGKKYRIIPFTKNRKPHRLYFGPEAYRILNVVKEVQDIARLRAGSRWNDSYGLVFTDETGRPFSPKEADEELRRLMADTDNPDVRLYDLRHTAATAVHRETGNITLAQTLMNHSDPDVTRNYYLDRDTRSKRLSAKAINDYTKGALKHDS